MNLETLLLFGGLIFVLGALAGYLVARFGREEQSKETGEIQAQSMAANSQPPGTGATELLRLWKDPQSGKIIFQAPDGHIIDASIAKNTLQQAFSQPTAVGQPAAVVKTPEAISPTAAAQARTPPHVEPHEINYGEVETVKMNPLESLSRTFQKPKTAAPRSIAGQIDDILQDRIAGSELARRGLRLLDLPDHGLGVVLDLHTYPGIDAVPDQAVQQIIHEAVAEWQNRYK